ncbi:MAG: hypothetical protein GDA56_12640 [Hormoscilla sp. GM7CHS1pb]|nr:hypothetical protein [Hormoscilla sp. GM7CHS1pb]
MMAESRSVGINDLPARSELETFEQTDLELTLVDTGLDTSHRSEDIFGNEMMAESRSVGINDLPPFITSPMPDLGYGSGL